VTSSASARRSATHAESAVKGEGPVLSEQLTPIINPCLLATLASSQYCNTGRGPAACWMSLKGGLSMEENQTDRSLYKENFLLSFLTQLPNIVARGGEISYMRSVRA